MALSSLIGETAYGAPGQPPITSMRRPSGPGMDLALWLRADPHERLAVELDALTFDVHPARAAERQEDLLLTALRVIVLGVVAVARRHLDHLKAERRDAELGPCLDEAAAKAGLHLVQLLRGVVSHAPCTLQRER